MWVRTNVKAPNIDNVFRDFRAFSNELNKVFSQLTVLNYLKTQANLVVVSRYSQHSFYCLSSQTARGFDYKFLVV